MNDIKKIFLIALLAVSLMAFNGCQQPGGNNTGSEFMPDMAHSVAFEANTYSYYYNNTWGSKEDYYKMAQPGKPVAGTVARGSISSSRAPMSTNSIKYKDNGASPYYYGDSDQERLRASNEIIKNPLKITDAGLAQGKELYNIYCGICHGEKGDGVGYLVRDPNPAIGDEGGKYPVQPANFLLEEFLAANNGRYYHAIQYGKNLMGNYRDKLSYEERWNVIHYIRSLQAKELKLAYNQMENTLNTVDEPAGEMAMVDDHAMGAGHDSGDHGASHDDGHGSDHDDSGDGHDGDHGDDGYDDHH